MWKESNTATDVYKRQVMTTKKQKKDAAEKQAKKDAEKAAKEAKKSGK